MKHRVTANFFEPKTATVEEVTDYYLRLLRGMAHNMNNILTIFQGYIGILELEGSSANASLRDALDHMLNGTDSASKLVQDILTAGSRVNLEIAPLEPRRFAETLEVLLPGRLPPGANFALTLARDTPTIQTDPRKLREIISLLLANSTQALAPDRPGKITLALQRGSAPHRDHLLVRLTDNGLGITPENLPLIFQPFFTTYKDRRQNGLGLSKAAGILRKLGGSIEIASEPGQGTEATLLLPPEPPRDTTTPSPDLPGAPGSSGIFRR